jgi:hypothetical protein
VNGALHGLDGEEVEAPNAPRTIPDVGFEQPLCVPLWYKQGVVELLTLLF